MRELFGHRTKKRSDSEKTPGRPMNMKDMPHQEMSRDNPSNYEGREHVKYKDPGYSSHEIDYPEDEPHMRGHVGKEEMHEMEDDYHMDVPDQSPHELAAHIKRARMKMDTPTSQRPADLLGNLVRNVGKGVEDSTGEEEEGSEYEQEEPHKEHRKKMIAAVVKKKMK